MIYSGTHSEYMCASGLQNAAIDLLRHVSVKASQFTKIRLFVQRRVWTDNNEMSALLAFVIGIQQIPLTNGQ